jgi:hypothetical protein
MKLTSEDKALLTKWGHRETDFDQIERATTKTTYKINYKDSISAEKAVELLGRETFLSGISRSAFHWSASRNIGESNDVVAFDSSKLFK